MGENEALAVLDCTHAISKTACNRKRTSYNSTKTLLSSRVREKGAMTNTVIDLTQEFENEGRENIPTSLRGRTPWGIPMKLLVYVMFLLIPAINGEISRWQVWSVQSIESALNCVLICSDCLLGFIESPSETGLYILVNLNRIDSCM